VRDNSARRIRLFPVAVIVALLAFLAAGTASNLRRNPQPGLVAGGIPGQQVPSATSAQLPSSYSGMVRQALADLDSLTLPNGATLAGWDGPWRFVWPRDASFVAAARCSVSQYAEAAGILSFLDKVRPTSGRWAARYSASDGTIPQDGREAQLDGSGWVLWAAWSCSAGLDLTKYWPMLRESGDQIVAELGPQGLPFESPDYWEKREPEVTLGTIAPLLSGLRSGLAIAAGLGRTAEVPTWLDALNRLSAATDRDFGPSYPRTPAKSFGRTDPGWTEPGGAEPGGADAIVTVLGPPFAPARPEVTEAIERSLDVLTQPNGGVTPGEQWRADGVAWTPQTTLFALSAAARGDRETAESLLTWLDAHRTSSGALPEKVNRDLKPAGEAPLGWTSALVILTATALDRPLPVPAP
jgi:GH15 family glucan-1,4-alpha-glucosidase